ncbi:predicted protein [Naegleria gruberi]|uniref:Predicted protein n=1 Tax=Naegleria gruberi TaxID=5762 RepID=D2W420_NAEGR|nr:uncharacterized protein NAEGRDRAFT_76150 [Naegleria gruberi]EFC36183.1 predicted protein [Naegleria gruberi]|eukprot:XP_002668927.1 predicted protein [Naegleria gruberi strain NEG-M]
MHTWCNSRSAKVSFIDETKRVKTKLEGKCRKQEPKLKRLRKDMQNNKLLKNYFVFHNEDPNADVFIYKVIQEETDDETIRNQDTVIFTEKIESKRSINEHGHSPSIPTKQPISPSNNSSEFLNIASFLSSLPLNSIDQLDVPTLKSLFGFANETNPQQPSQESSYNFEALLLFSDDESTFL